MLGTPGYFAPEQYNYPPNFKWNFQTDLYPLGIMIIEMCLPELRRNFSSLRSLETVYDVWHEKFHDDVRKMKLFKNIIAKLCAENRFNRFSSLDECMCTILEI